MNQGSDQAEIFRRYRRMQRLRRGVVIGFFPGALLVLLVTSGALPVIPAVLAWPTLLLFALGCMGLMQHTDHCPWCRRSFHTPVGATSAGFAGLLRRQCANCGQPRVADSAADR